MERIAVADFETTTIENADNFVYSWSLGYERTKGEIEHRTHPFNISNCKDIRFVERKGLTMYYGISIESFVDLCLNWKKDKYRQQIYFHNFGGFDGHFLVDYLSKNGFIVLQDYHLDRTRLPLDFVFDKINTIKQQYESFSDKARNSIDNNFSNKQKEINKLDDVIKEQLNFDYDNALEWFIASKWTEPSSNKEYSYISKNNKFYNLKFGETIEFRDSLKICTQMSVKDMGKSLTKAFHDHPEDKNYYNKYVEPDNGIDYKRTELFNSLDELENTGNELEYLFQDVFVLWKFLTYFINEKLIKQEDVDVKLTAGSTAYSDWKKMFRELEFNKHFIREDTGKTLKNGYKIYRYKTHDNKYVKPGFVREVLDSKINKLFPNSLGDALQLNVLRNAYRGGITQVNPVFQGKKVKVLHYDRHSSYPSVMSMAYNLFPVGMPLDKKPVGDSVSIITVKMINKVKNYKGMPFIPEDNRFSKSAIYKNELEPYIEDKMGNKLPRIISLTDAEFKQFIKQYRVKSEDYEIVEQVWFNAKSGKELFGMYYDKWYKLKTEAKANKDELMKIVAKTFLNALYGYFARRWMLSDDYLDYETLDKINENGSDLEYNSILPPTYLPIGIFITSYGRLALIQAVEDMWKEYGVYCDTDSIFCLKEGFDLINKEFFKLGSEDLDYWGEEDDSDNYAMFIRAKQYTIEVDQEKGIFESHIAGINFRNYNEDIKEGCYDPTKYKYWATFEELILGFNVPEQLRPHRIMNGVWLETYDKRYKPIWEQAPIADVNPIIYNRQYQENYANTL